ncbi:MAG: 4Fe-4S binding protein, partial [Bacteroidales bacterium]|nr:4Fe-4S binding protein [Bacteroidales bacterium]
MTTHLPVYTVSNNCQDCYKCIRECPVKAIRIENSRASIIEERCISCGHCTVVCPSGAKRYHSDLSLVESWIDRGDEVVLSVAPSIYSFFRGSQQEVVSHLLSLGFSKVSETAWGALDTSQLTTDWLKSYTG